MPCRIVTDNIIVKFYLKQHKVWGLFGISLQLALLILGPTQEFTLRASLITYVKH
jgi:hypothetical protein